MIEITPPSFEDTKPYLMADEVEVYLAFIQPEGALSETDLKGLIDKDSAQVHGVESGEEVEIYDSELPPQEEIDIELEGIAFDCKNHIIHRIAAYGDFYPFYLDEYDRICRHEMLSEKQKVYLFLLICSCLGLVTKSLSINLASKFEKICVIATQKWLPQADVRAFGPGSDDRRNFFGNNTRDALIKLAEFLNATPLFEKINRQRQDGSFEVSTSGDRGLDVVIKIPIANDNALGSLSFFAQCASRKTHWWHKKHEADPIEFANYVLFHNMPGTIVFIPVAFRDSDGTWWDHGQSGGSFLVDRFRLCQMLQEIAEPIDFVDDVVAA